MHTKIIKAATFSRDSFIEQKCRAHSLYGDQSKIVEYGLEFSTETEPADSDDVIKRVGRGLTLPGKLHNVCLFSIMIFLLK